MILKVMVAKHIIHGNRGMMVKVMVATQTKVVVVGQIKQGIAELRYLGRAIVYCPASRLMYVCVCVCVCVALSAVGWLVVVV